MSNLHSAYLKEMGITEWSSRDKGPEPNASPNPISQVASAPPTVSAEKVPQGYWWFFGSKPEGEAQALFHSVIRALGLGPKEWSWISADDHLEQLQVPDNGLPVVAFAFGGAVAQKITGEKDALPQLRETILALNNGADEEIPVIATFDLNQLIAKPKDKALLWQDLLLAKSVLQTI